MKWGSNPGSLRGRMSDASSSTKPPAPPSVFQALRGYGWSVFALLLLTVFVNAINLSVPRLVANGLDQAARGTFSLSFFALGFAAVIAVTFVLSYGQSIAQVLVSERVARDIRTRLAGRISQQSYAAVQRLSPSVLLTNFTSDVDAIKMFVAQGMVMLISSVFMLVGTSVMLLSIQWKLGLVVMGMIPLIGVAFGMVFGKVGPLFVRAQQSIDKLNRVINESILGAALIRVLNASQQEFEKFLERNEEAKTVGTSILRLFASLIPIITFVSGLATLAILLYGGKLIQVGDLTIGEFTAFNTYAALLVFPIIMIGFLSSMIGRSSASYARVMEAMNAPIEEASGSLKSSIEGSVEARDISLKYGEKEVLKHVSFMIPAGTRTAIVGPTAAGKTQLLSVLVGLTAPTGGEVLVDGRPITEYDPESVRSQLGIVFQESLLFQGTLRENIAFALQATEDSVRKAIQAAELTAFVEELPQGLDTPIAERAATLSGGQKQRLMLARALAAEPKVLLLDDFTARVDVQTEERILRNLAELYPKMTVISVTQKVATAASFDQVVLLMEGEVLVAGTHDALLHSSPEYAQIVQSQASVNV